MLKQNDPRRTRRPLHKSIQWVEGTEVLLHPEYIWSVLIIWSNFMFGQDRMYLKVQPAKESLSILSNVS